MRPVVIRFGRMGDTVLLAPLLAPLLALLHRGYGEPCTLLGTGPWSRLLYASHPDVHGILQLGNRHRPVALSPQLWRMAAVLFCRRDAAVYVCEPESRPLAKIRTVLALARVPPARCTFLADARARGEEHWGDRLLRFGMTPPSACAAAWHAPAVLPMAAPRLFAFARDRRDCREWLRARGWCGESIWIIQPCNHISRSRGTLRDPSRDHKSWPLHCWIAVLRALRADHPDAWILLTGAPSEAGMLGGIAGVLCDRRLHVAARGFPLGRVLALAELARGMLSVDTGPAHVAAAMGCPLVVLFGAASPAVWCPRSPTGSTVTPVGGPPGRNRVAQIAPEEAIVALRALRPRPSGSKLGGRSAGLPLAPITAIRGYE